MHISLPSSYCGCWSSDSVACSPRRRNVDYTVPRRAISCPCRRERHLRARVSAGLIANTFPIIQSEFRIYVTPHRVIVNYYRQSLSDGVIEKLFCRCIASFILCNAENGSHMYICDSMHSNCHLMMAPCTLSPT